ncbi:acyl-CoA N-acyltransferase [Pyrenochaeta sp. MPI-SDFR-AT-0127]|nr:acyl-CoA N-acyltransferase [Pyrenochaeta sp. MPI-SDFR-AT-0127]
MPLEIRPVEESDFEDFVRIQTAAFQGGGGITGLLTPVPLPANYIQKSIDKHIKSWRDEPDVTYLKVIDTDLDGKMIAGAKWRINEKERTEEQIKSMLPVPGPDEEGNPALQDFMRYLSRVRREYMGTKPFYFLHILATHPDHHRRGAGARLIAWGLEKADKVQLPAFLESSPMGRPLYARMGFEPKHEEVWDLTKYGREGTDTNTIMIREPLSQEK